MNPTKIFESFKIYKCIKLYIYISIATFAIFNSWRKLYLLRNYAKTVMEITTGDWRKPMRN